MAEYQTPYQALGEDGIRSLVSAFYDIMDERDDVIELRSLHADDLEPMKDKLGDYLVGWMGGPPVYADKYGTVCMTTPHEHFSIGPTLRDQWLLCMHDAMDRCAMEESVQDMLRQPLYRIADAVRNRPDDGTAKDDPNVIASC